MNSLHGLLFYCFILADHFLDTVTINTDLINHINNMGTTWTAGVNLARFPAKLTPRDQQKHVDVPKKPKVVVKKIPEEFDARTHFKDCKKIIERVRDQGSCDSSWAVATAAMLSDRSCIQTKGKVKRHLSANELLTCCKECYLTTNSPCGGGSPYHALVYFTKNGLVTGGEANSKEGCQPYDKAFYDGDVVRKCTKKCTVVNATAKRTKGKSIYKIKSKQIEQEIWKNGPVVAEITVYEDLYYYKEGLYTHQLGDELGSHFVKIVGWGKQDILRWWVVLNSLGKNFGENGQILFQRGVNSCGIESNVLTIKKIVGKSSARIAGADANEGVVVKQCCSRGMFAGVVILCLLLRPFM